MTSIKQVIQVNTVPEEVYDILTDPVRHAKLIGAKATGKAEVGGKFMAWDDYITGRYLELEPGQKIVAEWQTSEWPKDAPASHLEFILHAKDGGTELTMNHTNLPPDQVDQYAEGWQDNYWQPLQQLFN